MSREKVKLPPIVEDFEEGDRVYRHSMVTDNTIFGTVQKASNGRVIVLLDSQVVHYVSINYFQENEGVTFYWGKCLPLKQVEVGSVISVTTNDVTLRAVVDYISPYRITFTYVDNPEVTDSWVNTISRPLEFLLRNWELEG